MEMDSADCKNELSKETTMTTMKKKRTETPEEIAVRRKASVARAKKSRERKKAFKLAEQGILAPEEIANRIKKLEEETPDQKKTRLLAKKAEQRRLRRAQLLALETPEEREARRLKKNHAAQKCYRKRVSTLTPEKAEELRAKRSERHKQKRAKELANKIETSEQPAKISTADVVVVVAKERQAKTKTKSSKVKDTTIESDADKKKEIRRIKVARISKIYRERQLAMETPDQTAARLANIAKYMREKRAKLLASETPEETQARRLRRSEIARKKREEQRAKETPEQMAERRAKFIEQSRKHRARAKAQRSLETRDKKKSKASKIPEDAEMKKAYWAKMYRKRVTSESPEQRIARLARNAENLRKYRLRLKEKMRAMQGFGVNKLEQNDDYNESCTWSSFGPSEGSMITTTTEGGLSIATTDQLSSTHQSFGDEIIVKNEVSQDSWSSFDDSKSSFLTQKIFEENYYKYEDTRKVDVKEEAPSLPAPLIEPPVVQVIIVKEELDL